MPGTLPVANEEALRLTVLTGMLLGCAIPGRARFDRKNYFYPDVAKNYQITQYAEPSTREGVLEFEYEGGTERVRITRAHLEEDVAKNFHFARESGVDFNRAGVPLLEIVSEPDLRSATMAQAYLNALTEILVQAGVTDGDMEKGMLRCDVNVSVRPKGTETLGAKIEIKNMNTFSGVRRAIDHEIERQVAALNRGEVLRQETRRWDDDSGMTESMRAKEHAHDYRYFPDPDLVTFEPGSAWLEEVRGRVMELPLARKRRYREVYGLPAGDAEVLKSNRALGDFFERAAAGGQPARTVANWVVNNLSARLNEAGLGVEATPFPPEAVGELVGLLAQGKLSGNLAQEVFAEMFRSGKSPGTIVMEKGLMQVSDDGVLEEYCDQAMAVHPGPVGDYRAGKVAALNFLKGQVMKLSKGKANPGRVGEILEKKLKS
jgi:aspartyl-tRNA(Asn)/glutamyl-tRNA(Gln) amidotransferase subunit B